MPILHRLLLCMWKRLQKFACLQAFNWKLATKLSYIVCLIGDIIAGIWRDHPINPSIHREYVPADWPTFSIVVVVCVTNAINRQRWLLWSHLLHLNRGFPLFYQYHPSSLMSWDLSSSYCWKLQLWKEQPLILKVRVLKFIGNKVRKSCVSWFCYELWDFICFFI